MRSTAKNGQKNPPLLIVCDRERIVIPTAFTGYPDKACEIHIEQLLEAEKQKILKWVFTAPEKSTACDWPDYTRKSPAVCWC